MHTSHRGPNKSETETDSSLFEVKLSMTKQVLHCMQPQILTLPDANQEQEGRDWVGCKSKGRHAPAAMCSSEVISYASSLILSVQLLVAVLRLSHSEYHIALNCEKDRWQHAHAC